MKPRILPIAAALATLAASALALVATAQAGGPSPVDENGRAVHVVCPDGYGGIAVADWPYAQPEDCASLAEALQAATDNGGQDDLILLRPGYYCPVDLPQSGAGRLWLQGIPTAAYPPAGGDVWSPTHSVVEGVVFAPYAAEDCASIYNNDVIRMGPSGGLVFLENLAVDGSEDATYVPGTSSYANNGIELGGSSSYVRDVVVKHAGAGLQIAGGEVSHSAFVANRYYGVQTAANRPTWLQDVLIADNGSAGLYDGTTTNYAQNAPTLRNVTVTGNPVGLSRPPGGYYDTSMHVRNSLIAGNGTDCDYTYVGSEGGSDYNAVGPSCYSLSVGEHSTTTDGSGIAEVDHLSGFEPFADPGYADPEGDPATCSPTDQLERARTGCYVGAISPMVATPVGPTPPVSDLVGFPATLDLADTGSAAAYLENLRDGLVTVRDVSVTAGFAVARDSCSLGALPFTWITGQAAGGSAPQLYCSIVVTSASADPLTGTLTITTSKGVVTIQLSSAGTDDTGGPTDPTSTDTTSPPPDSESPTTGAPTTGAPTTGAPATGAPTSSAPPQARPGRPTKVKAKPKRKAAAVRWQAATSATSYLVQVKAGRQWVTKATVTATRATVKRLRSGKRVQLRVVAVNPAGQTPSAVVRVRPI